MATLFRTEQQYRSLALRLIEVACATRSGVPRRAGDPTFDAITRACSVSDSGSELLAIWLLRSLGVGSSFLHREVNQNWSRSAMAWFEGVPCIRTARMDDVYRPGDILRVGYYPHDAIVVVVEHEAELIHFAEYTPRGAEFSAFRRSERYRTLARAGAPYLGERPIVSWLSLMSILEYVWVHAELAPPDEDLFHLFEDTLPAVPGRVQTG